MSSPFRRVGIAGVGLIGGSLGLALKKAHPSIEVCGIGRDTGRLELARSMGAIDGCFTDLAAGVKGCDLVVLTTPVRKIVETLGHIGGFLSPGTLVTDAGSTKRSICTAAWRLLSGSVEFIGGHPVAGREMGGVEHSLAGLFEGAPYVLCPPPERNCAGLVPLAALLRSIGAVPVEMTPEEHDAAITWVSHLPQLISTTLANTVDRSDTRIAGSGLGDMIRLASSPYPMWEDILATNADNIDSALQAFAARLEELRRKLAAGNLGKEFAGAARVRERFLRRRPEASGGSRGGSQGD